MPEELPFRFSIRGLPLGEALTGSEIEQRLLETLDACGGKCPDSLWSLAILYQQTGHPDQASGCIQRFIDLTDDPEKIGAGYLALGQLEESRGDYTAAARRYREALSLEPCSIHTWYFIHNNLGYALNQTQEYASAIPYLQKGTTILSRPCPGLRDSPAGLCSPRSIRRDAWTVRSPEDLMSSSTNVTLQS